MAEQTHYDLIILGAGPAGMAAAIYAARKQIDMLILSGDVGGQATWSSGIENYLGYIFLTGTELVQKFEEHLKQFKINIDFNPATRVTLANGGFKVDTQDGRVFYGRAVVVATGKSPRLLEIEGEREFTGRGVTYCATCDGPLYAGLEIAVVGGGNSGLDAAIQMMKICPKVYIIEVKEKLCADEIVRELVEAADNVEILYNTSVKSIHGKDFVDSITIEDLNTHETRELPVRGVFVEVGLVPNSDLVKDILELNEYGEIPVDCAARTVLPGMYAAGDVTAIPEKQIIIAAGDGGKAALGAYSYIVRLPRGATDWGPRSDKT